MSELEKKYRISLDPGRSDTLEEYFQSSEFDKPSFVESNDIIQVDRKLSAIKNDQSTLITISGFAINKTALISRKDFCNYVKEYLDELRHVESEIYVKGVFCNTKSRDEKVKQSLKEGKVSIVRCGTTSLVLRSIYFYVPNNETLDEVYEAIGYAAYKNNNRNKKKEIADYKQEELGLQTLMSQHDNSFSSQDHSFGFGAFRGSHDAYNHE